jgi:hypothetical protein
MIRAYQPGSHIDIPEVIPNPAVALKVPERSLLVTRRIKESVESSADIEVAALSPGLS